ncbi:Holliday junction ATP-dependent DNA helicase RuvB [Labeo rohita]|uniref:Holliday junction ATP-dependent DNA helicase RuvB n=1 Tax=Labeo rohita TaxID=84645 RepID=A0ABQ8MBG6_LABRO|nr:Holliday junction ATP-dependent DNA helicase RuvB [Labeo rohita]
MVGQVLDDGELSDPFGISNGDTVLTAVDKFCCLGSILAAGTTVDCDISALCMYCKSTAFGQLSKRKQDEYGIRLDTKVAVYKNLMASTVPGC